MHRIDTATRAVDLFGPGKHGFKNGNPLSGDPATALNAEWFNAIQEELARVIESAAIALDSGAHDQLLRAIQMLVPNSVPAATSMVQGKVRLATGTETQAGMDSSRAVTPAGLASLTATTERRGLVELSTPEEAAAGEDTERAVTAAGVKAAYAQFGLGGSALFNGHLDDLVSSGFYYAGSESTGKPSGINGHVLVSRFATDADYVVQRFIPGGTLEPREFVRMRAAGTWGAWREVWVGNVGQSLAGSGYQRLPSGLIIQWGAVNVPFSTSWTSQAITFPVAFPTATVNVTPVVMNGTDVAVDLMVMAAPSATGATVRYKTDVAGSIFSLRWSAVGY